jgi:transposase
MSANAYRLLGYLVWKGGKWYVRQRLPPARALALRGLLTGGALTAIVLVARRAKG